MESPAMAPCHSKVRNQTVPAASSSPVSANTNFECSERRLDLSAASVRAKRLLSSISTRNPIPPAMIRMLTVRLTNGSARNPIRLSGNRPNPALQKALMILGPTTLAESDRFEAALQAAGTRGRVERYWGLHHGFAFDDRPAHDPVGEARHWDRLFDLFDRNLRT